MPKNNLNEVSEVKKEIQQPISIEEKINNVWLAIKKLNKKSTFFYVFINILSFSLTAALIILNIFAIKWNPNPDINKKLFVTIAVIAGLVSALISINSLFGFKKIINSNKRKIHLINEEYKKYKHKEDIYKNKNRDELIIKKVFELKHD